MDTDQGSIEDFLRAQSSIRYEDVVDISDGVQLHSIFIAGWPLVRRMEFDVFLERDETGTWVAEVPSLPGVYSQGDTKEEAVENVKDAIKLYLATEGMPPSRAISIERIHVEA